MLKNNQIEKPPEVAFLAEIPYIFCAQSSCRVAIPIIACDTMILGMFHFLSGCSSATPITNGMHAS